ncbi:MAG: hypothetical protein LBH91_03690 [Prevotellaceae bacterium]|jgi:hypothetical protein|nr:hypothetical protein [Prevotellaceae bacterium]
MAWNPAPPSSVIYGFTLYQWDDALTVWQTISANYDKPIKVLNVYPDLAGSNTLKTWNISMSLSCSVHGILIIA